MPFQDKRPSLWKPLLLLATVVTLCVAFKGYGILISVIVLATYLIASQIRPHSPEIESIRGSIKLSIEDIEATMRAIERSDKHPQLANFFQGEYPLESGDWILEDAPLYQLVLEYQQAHLAITKVRERLEATLRIEQLEKLLKLTDKRSEALYEAWTNCPKSLLMTPRLSSVISDSSQQTDSQHTAARQPAAQLEEEYQDYQAS